MDMDVKSTGRDGVGFLSLLFLLFLGLKLGGWIDWSWWWVFAPIWIPLLITLVLLGIVVIYVMATKKKATK